MPRKLHTAFAFCALLSTNIVLAETNQPIDEEVAVDVCELIFLPFVCVFEHPA